MNYSSLYATIAENIFENHLNRVTAEMVKAACDSIVNSLGYGYQFRGAAAPGDAGPGNIDQRVFYIASTPGTYSGFGGLTLAANEVALLKWDTEWHKETLDVPSKTQVMARLAAQDAQIAAQDVRLDGQDQEIADFEEAVQNQVDNYPMITINGNVTNAPDEEDITTDANDLLKFKNRSAVDGMGYVILRKGGNNTFANQVTAANTIYEIRYDFDLGGASVTIPTGCHLDFVGGKLSNGTIDGNQASINVDCGYNIFNDCAIRNFAVPHLDVRWFGAVSDYDIVAGTGTDASEAFQRAFDNQEYNLGLPVYVCGRYYIANPVNVYGDFAMRGESTLINNLAAQNFYDNAKSEGGAIIGVAHGITAFVVVGSERSSTFNDLKISTIVLSRIRMIEGKLGDYTRTAIFMDYTCCGAPCRPGVIEKITATGFKRVFQFSESGNKQSVYGTLLINSIVAKFNENVVYAVSEHNLITMSKVEISNSELSDNIGIAIYIEGLYSPLSLRNNNFEGSRGFLHVTTNSAISPAVTIENCYSEGNLNGGTLIDARGQVMLHLTMRCNVIMNTNYEINLENVSFSQESNYIDLSNKINVIGNSTSFPDYSYMDFVKDASQCGRIIFRSKPRMTYEQISGQNEMRFHKSFTGASMYYLMPDGQWGYKCTESGKGAVSESSVQVAEGDDIYVLLCTNLANNRNALIVNSPSTQGAISNVISLTTGLRYILLHFKATGAANNATPMLQGLGLQDMVSFGIMMVNPTIAELRAARFINHEKCLDVTDFSNVNAPAGEQIGLSVFSKTRGKCGVWDGTEWKNMDGTAL